MLDEQGRGVCKATDLVEIAKGPSRRKRDQQVRALLPLSQDADPAGLEDRLLGPRNRPRARARKANA